MLECNRGREGGYKGRGIGDWRVETSPRASHRQCHQACKPGSVPRSAWERGDDHSSRAPVARRLLRPTRAARLETRLAVLRPPRRPYSVLLPVGFAVPFLLPGPRCALTAPFHPYPSSPEGFAGRFAFCGTVPGVAPAGGYPAPCFHGARTFLPARRYAGNWQSGHPAC